MVAVAGCDLAPKDKPPLEDLAMVQRDFAGTTVDLATGQPPDMAGVVAPPDMSLRTVGAPFDDPQLALREVSFGLALRTASLKLVGDLPTSDEQNQLATAQDQRGYYESRIAAYRQDPRFASQMVAFFRNNFRTGGPDPGLPSLETAPVFAASLVVSGQPFTNVLTAKSGTCPTFNAQNGVFSPANCSNNAQTAGVLGDPGVQALWYSNMAFRRARWVQETFACNSFPTEFRGQPVTMGGGLYTSPWDFNSISGTPVNFKADDTLICANCHTTINHVAPLFGNFDTLGVYTNSIQVHTPVPNLPLTTAGDWLPMGEPTAWRVGVPAPDLPSLGMAIANDPVFATCMVTRVYDWVMSKDDVVLDSANVPAEVIAPYRDLFVNGNYDLGAVVTAIFTSDDFVKF
jgi:hypothetical protein